MFSSLLIKRNFAGLANRRIFSSLSSPLNLSDFDATQMGLMNEKIILTNENDEMIGSASKLECHFQALKLHRAFSVLLFNEENKLLIQKRSDKKIVLPNAWANTCCSHPQWDENNQMMHEKNLNSKINQVKHWAIQRMSFELGINELNVKDLTFCTRILYLSNLVSGFGEYEIDYILLGKKNVSLSVNRNEVSEVRYVNRDELMVLINGCKIYSEENMNIGCELVSPWFYILVNTPLFLFKWWDDVENMKEGKINVESDEIIHNFVTK